jgi:putative ABC transport system permease protein
VIGTYPAYLPISNDSIATGSAFTADDVNRNRKVVVIGQTVVTNLFGSIDPIGKTIQLGGVPYTVVGTLTAKGGASTFNDPDNVVIAPLTTVQDSLTGFGSLTEIAVQAASSASATAAQAEVSSLLLQAHHVTASTQDFSVTNEASLLSTAQSTTQTFTVLLAAVAAISLLVGGIGVTNIMLVTVTERTREIGIQGSRRAARRDPRAVSHRGGAALGDRRRPRGRRGRRRFPIHHRRHQAGAGAGVDSAGLRRVRRDRPGVRLPAGEPGRQTPPD